MKRLILNKNEPLIQLVVPGSSETGYILAAEFASAHTVLTLLGSTLINQQFDPEAWHVGSQVSIFACKREIRLIVWVEGDALIQTTIDEVALRENDSVVEIVSLKELQNAGA